MKTDNRESTAPPSREDQGAASELLRAFRGALEALSSNQTSGLLPGSKPGGNRLASISVELEKIGRIQVEVQLADAGPGSELLAVPLDNAARVKKAKDLLADGAVYPKGCSEFVCKVLGIAYKQANDLMGVDPPSVGNGPTYDLEPGDIVGWINTTGSGHVAVYVGDDSDNVFIDVREPGAKPRSKNGYYNHEVFKAPY